MGLFFVLCLVIQPVKGQTNAFPLRFEHANYDFGMIGELGGTVYHQFTFQNTGSDTVWIVSAKAACHCTVGDYPREPIPPKGRGSIKVSYDPTGRPWEFESGVELRLKNRPETLPLNIKGNTIGGAETIRFAPAEYVQKFQYNEKVIEAGEAGFRKFVEQLVPLLEKHKSIKIQIESSASHVPTKTFSDNRELTAVRAREARSQMLEILTRFHADLSKVEFLDDITLVQGPAYSKDYKKHMDKYVPFQYVKIRVF